MVRLKFGNTPFENNPLEFNQVKTWITVGFGVSCVALEHFPLNTCDHHLNTFCWARVAVIFVSLKISLKTSSSTKTYWKLLYSDVPVLLLLQDVRVLRNPENIRSPPSQCRIVINIFGPKIICHRAIFGTELDDLQLVKVMQCYLGSFSSSRFLWHLCQLVW